MICQDLADALTADEARQSIGYFLAAVHRLDESGDVAAFVADMRRAVEVTEASAYGTPQQTVKAGQWPQSARNLALTLVRGGKSKRQAAREISHEYGRLCSHALVRHWMEAA